MPRVHTGPRIVSVSNNQCGKPHNSGGIDKNTKKGLVFLVWKLGINPRFNPGLVPPENKT